MISLQQMSTDLTAAQSLKQYDEVIDRCRHLFIEKTKDYGTAWRILRLPSLTDQIFIKARRIRSIQQKGVQRIADGIDQEFVAIINYGIMSLIQLDLNGSDEIELPLEQVSELYDSSVEATRELFANKNHDYGEVWRDMRVSSMTDLILMKILRIKQIEDNAGVTRVSEGVRGNYQDIINYAIFCMIILTENEQA